MRRLVGLVLAAMLVLSGCASLAEPDEIEEDWENFQQPVPQEEPEDAGPAEPVCPAEFSLPYHRNQTLDPVTCGEGIQETVASLVYEPLFALDEQFRAEPVLCAGYEWNETGLVCTLTLRDGVTFSDGSALTARDVAETLQRAMESERYAYRLRDVASAAANRAGQVVITLAAPNRGLPALLDIPIVKRTTAEWPVPVGSGPYLFVSDPGGDYLMAREDWWQQKKCPVGTIPLVQAKDPETARFLFDSGRVELLTADPTGDPSLAAGKSQITGQPTAVMQFIGFNTAEGRVFASAALRALFSLGIDRETLVDRQLVHMAAAAQFPISPLSPLYPKELEKAYDENQMLSALTNAGQASGDVKDLVMLVCQGNAFRSASARFIAEKLSLLDWNISVSELPWEEYLAALEAGEFDLYFGEVRLTADWNIADLVGTDGPLNYGGFGTDATDLLLAEFAAADQQEEAAKRLMANLQAYAPVAPICFKEYAVLTHPGVVEGISPAPGGVFRNMEKWTVHLAPEPEPEMENPEVENDEAADPE